MSPASTRSEGLTKSAALEVAGRLQVQEIAPPWVRTDLMNSTNEPRAMPLKLFIEETMKALGKDDEEVLVESAKALRNNPGPSEHPLVTQFNDAMAGNPPK